MMKIKKCVVCNHSFRARTSRNTCSEKCWVLNHRTVDNRVNQKSRRKRITFERDQCNKRNKVRYATVPEYRALCAYHAVQSCKRKKGFKALSHKEKS